MSTTSSSGGGVCVGNSNRANKLRIRKRSVRFGNPSMFTYHGSVYTAEEQREGYHRDGGCGGGGVDQQEQPHPYHHYHHLLSKSQRPLVEGAIEVERLVAMVAVPPEQVPEGVLNLVRSHRPWINHVRIVIEDNNNNSNIHNNCDHDDEEEYGDDDDIEEGDEYDYDKPLEGDGTSMENNEADLNNPGRVSSYAMLPSPIASAVESAASILAAEQQQTKAVIGEANKKTKKKQREQQRQLPLAAATAQHHQLQPSRTYLVLFEMSHEKAAEQLVEYLHGQPYTCLDEEQTCSLYHVVALRGDDGVSLISPFFSISTKSKDKGLEIIPSVSNSNSSGDSQDNNNNLVSNCVDTEQGGGGGTQRHHLPSATTEDYNCAVCLEHMQLDWAHSGGERTSILTTVCNHSFHMDCLLQWQDSPCPVCRYDHSGLNEALSRCHVCGTTDNNFVCLICGVVSCGGGGGAIQQQPQPQQYPAAGITIIQQETTLLPTTTTPSVRISSSHARQHYDETLHAYALDTETQHVWDFAGGGYVHRLLQNKEDGKLVEVNDPRNTTSQERTLSPGLSDAQEGEVVHRKLEGFASQYYTLLKSQLEMQRVFYEGRLEEIRREHIKEDRPRKRTSDLINAIKNERHQLSQRLATLKSRRDKVRDDVAFLKSMNESLETNKCAFRQQLQEAQKNRIEMRRVFESLLPPLQQQVTTLMLQLESEIPVAQEEDSTGSAAVTSLFNKSK